MSTDPRILAPGTRIAGFVIEGVAGLGGMAVVYRARETSLGRLVALKVLSGELAKDPTFRERFRREAGLVAALDHPNLVPVYDFGDAGDRPYIAMRYVPGGTLADALRSGGLTAREALHVLGALAGALDRAHAAGVLHRDVKPQNVLLSEDGHAYLTDFGIAKAAGASPLTEAGGVLGSLQYVAPEQHGGGEATARSDVYALAVVAYECLTGAPPYDDGMGDAASRLVGTERPVPLQPAGDPVAARLGAALEAGIAHDPADRPATPSAFVASLLDALGDPDPAFVQRRPLFLAAHAPDAVVPLAAASVASFSAAGGGTAAMGGGTAAIVGGSALGAQAGQPPASPFSQEGDPAASPFSDDAASPFSREGAPAPSPFADDGGLLGHDGPAGATTDDEDGPPTVAAGASSPHAARTGTPDGEASGAGSRRRIGRRTGVAIGALVAALVAAALAITVVDGGGDDDAALPTERASLHRLSFAVPSNGDYHLTDNIVTGFGAIEGIQGSAVIAGFSPEPGVDGPYFAASLLQPRLTEAFSLAPVLDGGKLRPRGKPFRVRGGTVWLYRARTAPSTLLPKGQVRLLAVAQAGEEVVVAGCDIAGAHAEGGESVCRAAIASLAFDGASLVSGPIGEIRDALAATRSTITGARASALPAEAGRQRATAAAGIADAYRDAAARLEPLARETYPHDGELVTIHAALGASVTAWTQLGRAATAGDQAADARARAAIAEADAKIEATLGPLAQRGYALRIGPTAPAALSG